MTLNTFIDIIHFYSKVFRFQVFGYGEYFAVIEAMKVACESFLALDGHGIVDFAHLIVSYYFIGHLL